MSIATLTNSLKDAFKLQGFKKDLGKKKSTSAADSARKGEAATVFVSIMSRMILVPALVLPAVVALAWFDFQRVADE